MAITPNRFIALKTAIKNECNRRIRNGSVQAYAGAEYDFSRTPTAGTRINQEFYTKNAIPLNAINGTTPTSGDRKISEAETASMEAAINSLAAVDMRVGTQTGTGCAASCTGLCYGGCWNSCSGCGGSCSSSCSGDCDGGCKGCGSGCSGSCSKTCSGGCESGCSSGCSTTCRGLCANTNVKT